MRKKRNELTQQEWKTLIVWDPSKYKSNNLPINVIDWFNVIWYCNILSISENLDPSYNVRGETDPEKWTDTFSPECDWDENGYRLPTESEWEYAGRGGVKSKNKYLFSGSNDIEKVGWVSTNSEGKPHPVGKKKSNEMGIFDITGNIYKWCWDFYDEDYSKKGVKNNPHGPQAGYYRMDISSGYWFTGGVISQIPD